MQEKLGKVREQGNITEGGVHSLTTFMLVQKGIEDMQMVFDETKLGLNNALWVPRFPLPTLNTILRAVDENTFMGNMDIGEMF
jgi:hypothetical protein